VYILFYSMSVSTWLKARGVELGAALCTAGILIAGLWIGVPFLRERIAETFLYSFCCVSAVLLRAALDLAVRVTVWAAQSLRTLAPVPVPNLGHSRA
jgi:hypothetical protein